MKKILVILMMSIFAIGGFYIYSSFKENTSKVVVSSLDEVKKVSNQEYLKEQKERLKKLDAEIYIVTKEDEEEFGSGYCYRVGMEELVYTKDSMPIQNLCPGDREYFKDVIEEKVGLGCDKDKILKAIPTIKEDDFKNCGELRDSIDWQIFLNNLLQRLGYEPRHGEDLDGIIESELFTNDDEINP